MPLEPGSAVPSVPVQQLVEGEVQQIDLSAYSTGKTIILISLPGAFTPPCSENHLPGYFAQAQALKDKGVDAVVVVAPNDFFVANAWAATMPDEPLVQIMADGSGRFTAAAGQQLDLGDLGLGMRSQRYAAVVRDGKVDQIYVEPEASVVTVSGAEEVLAAL